MKPISDEQTDAFLARLDKRFASANILLELPDGKIIIVKSWYKKRWSVPGGLIDAGESPLQAACREVREEVGLVIDPERVRFRLVISQTSERLGGSYAFIFVTQVTTEELSHVVLQAKEIDEMAVVSKQEVLAQTSRYSHSVIAWASDERGYIERSFDEPIG